MYSHRRTVLASAFVITLFALYLLLVHRLFPFPFLGVDTEPYLLALSPTSWAASYRTPGYGLLLLLGHVLGGGSAVLWFQVGSFLFLAGCVVILSARLLHSSLAGFLVGCSFLLYHSIDPSFVVFTWHLLSDSPFSVISCVGFIILTLSYLRSSTILFLSSALFFGIALVVRPMPGSFLISLGMLVLVAWKLSCQTMRRWHGIVGLFLLLLPIGSYEFSRVSIGGGVRTHPMLTLHLMSFVPKIAETGDDLFGDATKNVAFSTLLRTGEWHGIDPIGFPVHNPVYAPMRAFLFEGLEQEPDALPLFFERVQGLTLRAIQLHPLSYMRTVLHNFFELCAISPYEESTLSWSDPNSFYTYIFHEIPVSRSMRIFTFGSDQTYDATRIDLRVIPILNPFRTSFHSLLLMPWVHRALFLASIISCFYGAMLWRSQNRERSGAGLFLLSLNLWSLSTLLSTAMIMYVEQDLRYRLPYALSLSITLPLLSLLILRDARTHVLGWHRSFFKFWPSQNRDVVP